MILDAHIHVFDGPWIPSWFWNMLDNIMAPIFGMTVEQMAEARQKTFDPSGDLVISSMDKAGIDKAIVCVVDIGFMDNKEDAPASIEEVNRLTSELVRKHSDRLYFAAGVDPRRKNALEVIDTSVKDWGAKSLKLQPCAGWYPSDRMVYPVYEKCVELGIPVNFHTGPQPYPFKSKCGHPKYIEDVADDFPELTIHCTHAGDVLYTEMLALAKAHQNVIVDFASWQRWLGGSRTTALAFYRTLRIFMDMLGPRVMFASDFDGKLSESGYCDWVKSLVDIPNWVKEAGIEFTKDEMDGFLGGNAVKLLRL